MHKGVAVCWFRRDLRIHDNAAFWHALESGNDVLPVFIFDRYILDNLSDPEDKRVNFIYENLMDMQEIFHNKGSSFLIIYDHVLEAFKYILSKWSVKEVFTNTDYEPYAVQRDGMIREFLAGRGIAFKAYKDQVIFEKNEILKPEGTPYHVFTPYSKIWLREFTNTRLPSYPSETLLHKLVETIPLPVPDIEQLGFKKAALNLSVDLPHHATMLNYHTTRDIPGIDGTSKASVHLRFGTISVRQLARLAAQYNPVYLKELIWREFFMMLLYHYPRVIHQNFNNKYDLIVWRNNETEFKKWCDGETGFPLVDAGMRQLNETGWMHNRIRMVTAGFLCKDLLIDWRWGEAYFAEKLLDYELSSNNGNWQWAAGTGADAAPYFRIFNPTLQIKKFDPKLVYINQWIKDFKPGYLPEIVDHDFARKRAMDAYKIALERKLMN